MFTRFRKVCCHFITIVYTSRALHKGLSGILPVGIEATGMILHKGYLRRKLCSLLDEGVVDAARLDHVHQVDDGQRCLVHLSAIF